MFNYVEGIDLDCPRCGYRLEWQSKWARVRGESGMIYCIDASLSTLNLADLYDGEAHSYCDRCGGRTDLEIKEGKVVEVIPGS